ncbi:unnamed protein product [Toxocara canis]|uniref:Uncharacterized protein n=1 Tax=Toxocara canis TaxID=6265 RepID=A0A183UU52_TOXCA|nr:unnamed protein product [Toxocara canis]
MLQAQPKLSIATTGPACSAQCSSQLASLHACPHVDEQRSRLKQHWTLSTGAFHQSFDDRNQGRQASLSNSCGDLDDPSRFQRKRRSAYCSGVGRGNYYSGASSGTNSAAGGKIQSLITVVRKYENERTMRLLRAYLAPVNPL